MAAASSPSLTSSSHTLTATPIMAGPLSNANGDVLALLDRLCPDRRHVFLQPSGSLPTESLNIVKDTLEGFAAQVSEEQQQRLKESRKRKRARNGAGGDGEGDVQDVLKLRKVYVDGFETAQVWQQAKKIIGSVLDFSGKLLDELEANNEIAAKGAVTREEDASAAVGEEILDEDDNDDVRSSDQEEEDGGRLSEELLSEAGLDGELEGDEEADLEAAKAKEDEENEEEDSEGGEYVEDPNGLNDGFFSIDEFNRQTQWFEEQDARGNPNADQASDDEEIDWGADPMAPSKEGSKNSSKRKSEDNDGLLEDEDKAGEEEEDDDDDEDDEDGPTFGDMALDAPEGDSEDEAVDDAATDDQGMDFNANEVYFNDFFAPPPRKHKGGKSKKKNLYLEPEQPAKEDIERAMADVRRDLFDDESEKDGSGDALSEVSAGDVKSRRSAHERRQAKLAGEIRKLEAASVAKREWTLSGEAAAADRPVNSLLEEDLDFEHVGKPIPVITPEVTEGIEDMIKRRILAQQFDEVLRRRPDPDAPASTRRGMIELDDSKPNKSLAEVYEEEHVKKANPDSYVSASDEKLQREEKEIGSMWRDVSARLDALSSWRYKPKPATPTLSVVADVATVSMEDAQPATASALAGQSSRLAPQEVYKAGAESAAQGEVVTGSGLPVARREMTREEKLRRRRRQKERVRKAGGPGGKKKPLGARARTQRDTIAELKKGGVKVINRKGEVTDVEGNKAKVAKIASSGSYKL